MPIILDFCPWRNSYRLEANVDGSLALDRSIHRGLFSQPQVRHLINYQTKAEALHRRRNNMHPACDARFQMIHYSLAIAKPCVRRGAEIFTSARYSFPEAANTVQTAVSTALSPISIRSITPCWLGSNAWICAIKLTMGGSIHSLIISMHVWRSRKALAVSLLATTWISRLFVIENPILRITQSTYVDLAMRASDVLRRGSLPRHWNRISINTHQNNVTKSKCL